MDPGVYPFRLWCLPPRTRECFSWQVFEDALAIRLANRLDRMIGRLDDLSERRRIATIKDTLFSRILDSLIWNTTHVGTGAILILAGQSMQNGTFSIGDFARLVFYLGWISMLVQATARTITQYKQTEVSLERLLGLMQDTPPERLVKHSPVPLKGELPAIPPVVRTEADRLERLEVKG